jgi:hypothetical protein
MSKEQDNKAVVGRWFTEFWGKRVNLEVVDEIAAPACCSNTRCMNSAAAATTSRRS